MTETQRNNRLHVIFQEALGLLLEQAADEERASGSRKMTPTVRAIRHVEAVLTDARVGCGCICHCPVIDGHTGECPVVRYLPGEV